MTFATWVAPGYTREKFENRKLDYSMPYLPIELWGEPTTGVVVWRPKDSDAARLRGRLLDAWVSLTELDGEVWLRSVAANPSANVEHVWNRVVTALEAPRGHL